MMEKIKLFIERYKEWSNKHPIRSTFLLGFILGVITGCILC